MRTQTRIELYYFSDLYQKASTTQHIKTIHIPDNSKAIFLTSVFGLTPSESIPKTVQSQRNLQARITFHDVVLSNPDTSSQILRISPNHPLSTSFLNIQTKPGDLTPWKTITILDPDYLALQLRSSFTAQLEGTRSKVGLADFQPRLKPLLDTALQDFVLAKISFS